MVELSSLQIIQNRLYLPEKFNVSCVLVDAYMPLSEMLANFQVFRFPASLNRFEHFKPQAIIGFTFQDARILSYLCNLE